MLLNKIKEKKIIENFLIFLVLAISFICVLKINLNTHIYHDEFVYSAIYGTEEKIHSFNDILKSTYNLYLTHNGRAITHMVLMLLLQSGNIFRSVINSIMFSILIFELIQFSSLKKSNNYLKISVIILLFPLLWCKIPAFGETIIWFAGSLNYLWTTTALLLLINISQKIFVQENEYKGIKLFLLCSFSFIVASLHEMTGIVAITIIGLMLIWLFLKNKKINKTLLMSVISSCIGFLIIILSPGSNVRKIAELQTMDTVPDLFQRLKTALIMLKGTVIDNWFIFTIIGFTITCLVIHAIKKRKRVLELKNEITVIFLLISGILSYISMCVSPTFLLRVTFIPFIIFVLTALKCLYILGTNKKIVIIECIMLIFAFSFFTYKTIPQVKETFKLVKTHKEAWDKRDEEINRQISEGKKDIYVEPLNAVSNSHLYYGDLSTSITFNHNRSMSVYYEINSIRIKQNYYLDIYLENVNRDNADSIKLSSNNYETTGKFYLLDRNIYNKLAPYKRLKNTFEGRKYNTLFCNE